MAVHRQQRADGDRVGRFLWVVVRIAQDGVALLEHLPDALDGLRLVLRRAAQGLPGGEPDVTDGKRHLETLRERRVRMVCHARAGAGVARQVGRSPRRVLVNARVAHATR